MAAVEILREAVDDVKRLNLKLSGIKTHALVSGGIVEGSALVNYADSHNIDLVILGRKDQYSWYSIMFQSLAGCIFPDSVSTYCMHNMHCPVMLVTPDSVTAFDSKQQIGGKAPEGKGSTSSSTRRPREICLVCESSQESADMVHWAVGHLLRPADRLTVVSVSSTLKPATPHDSTNTSFFREESFDAMVSAVIPTASRSAGDFVHCALHLSPCHDLRASKRIIILDASPSGHQAQTSHALFDCTFMEMLYFGLWI
jgi:hypothetical protein